MTFFRKLKSIKLPVKYSEISSSEKYIIRQQYVSNQIGLCYHCKGSLQLQPPEYIRMQRIDPGLYPENFFNHKIHLHHDHNTDLTLGVVHSYCNAILWEYHDE